MEDMNPLKLSEWTEQDKRKVTEKWKEIQIKFRIRSTKSCPYCNKALSALISNGMLYCRYCGGYLPITQNEYNSLA